MDGKITCERNSSYSFAPIFLKLYRCFNHGLKICMCFIHTPQSIFFYFLFFFFFHTLNLDFFQAQIQYNCIGRYV